MTSLGDLTFNENELRMVLEKDPNIVTLQDADGMTLLHHAARLGLVLGSTSISKIFEVLFQASGLDFCIKDTRGNTPVHMAAICSYERVSCQYVFPYFVREADKRNYDFSTVNKNGNSVLEIAMRVSYDISNAKRLLDNVTHAKIMAPQPASQPAPQSPPSSSNGSFGDTMAIYKGFAIRL